MDVKLGKRKSQIVDGLSEDEALEWIDRMKLLSTCKNVINFPEKGIVIYLKLYTPSFHYPHIMLNKYILVRRNL